MLLNFDAKLIRKKPYIFNPGYKEKLKENIERILDARIITPVEES